MPCSTLFAPLHAYFAVSFAMKHSRSCALGTTSPLQLRQLASQLQSLARWSATISRSMTCTPQAQTSPRTLCRREAPRSASRQVRTTPNARARAHTHTHTHTCTHTHTHTHMLVRAHAQRQARRCGPLLCLQVNASLPITRDGSRFWV